VIIYVNCVVFTLQTVGVAKLSTSSSPSHLMQLTERDVSGPDSVELARTLNEIGVLHYLQNNTSSVLAQLTNCA